MGTSLIRVMGGTTSDGDSTHPIDGGVPIPDGGQMEEPQYSDINVAELQEIEAELGHPVTRELAQWFIRNRINREAVERMLAATDTNGIDIEVHKVRNIKHAKTPKPVSGLKKIKKKCA
jgi:hypothetical protein